MPPSKTRKRRVKLNLNRFNFPAAQCAKYINHRFMGTVLDTSPIDFKDQWYYATIFMWLSIELILLKKQAS